MKPLRAIQLREKVSLTKHVLEMFMKVLQKSPDATTQ